MIINKDELTMEMNFFSKESYEEQTEKPIKNSSLLNYAQIKSTMSMKMTEEELKSLDELDTRSSQTT